MLVYVMSSVEVKMRFGSEARTVDLPWGCRRSHSALPQNRIQIHSYYQCIPCGCIGGKEIWVFTLPALADFM